MPMLGHARYLHAATGTPVPGVKFTNMEIILLMQGELTRNPEVIESPALRALRAPQTPDFPQDLADPATGTASSILLWS